MTVFSLLCSIFLFFLSDITRRQDIVFIYHQTIFSSTHLEQSCAIDSKELSFLPLTTQKVIRNHFIYTTTAHTHHTRTPVSNKLYNYLKTNVNTRQTIHCSNKTRHNAKLPFGTATGNL